MIPARNGMATLPQLFLALKRQRHVPDLEIIAVDSGSTDGTVAFLRAHADCLIEVPPETFNHGSTRNLGISHGRGDLVVLLVQDAVPVSDDWLAALIAPFAAEPALAGTFSGQRPRADASAIVRMHLERWMSSLSRPRPRIGGDEWGNLTPMERLRACAFDNVSSCVRRSVWQEIPFIETPIAEDLAWGLAAQRAGYAIRFVPESVVEHSHDRPARYELARTYILHRRLFELFELRTIPGVGDLLRAITGSMASHVQCLRASGDPVRLPALARALALAVAWPLGQFVGGLSAARHWRPFRVRGV